MSKEFIADCGHLIPGTGYGRDANGVTFCYDCAAIRERATMVKTGKATLYLVRDESRDTNGGNGFPLGSRVKAYKVTDWPGKLSFACFPRVARSRNGGGFGAQRTDAWFAGPDGFVWHAVNRGDMDVARCKRTKERISA